MTNHVVITEERNQRRAQLIYDPANSISGVDVNTSLVANNPSVLIAEGMVNDASSISVEVWVKVHADGVWFLHTALDDALVNEALMFGIETFNFVKLVRVGTANFKVYVQY